MKSDSKDNIKMQKETSNKMGTMPEGKLLLSMGTPLMMSMLVAALYNLVDSFFVAHIEGIGDAAVNALTLAFPVQMLMTALTVGTGVGVGAVLSHSLGRKDQEKANKIAGNAIFLYICYYILLCLFGIFGTKTYIAGQTGDEVVLELGTKYLQIVSCFSFGFMGEKCFEKLLQSTGKATFSMIGQLTGSVLNIILDPILIFGLFNAPKLGVSGAAIATVISQGIAVLVSGTLHFRKNKELSHKIKDCKPDIIIIKEIYKVGAPAILMQALTSVMTYGMNIILKEISAVAVTAYGIYFRLQNFIFMPAFGLNNASIPIIGFNRGAAKLKRVKNTIMYGLIIVTGIMIFGFILFQCFAPEIVGIFGLSESVNELCTNALKIISFGFVFAGVNIILQGACQALGNGTNSLIISMMRMVILVLPLAKLISQMENAQKNVWIVFPIAEIITSVIAIYITFRLYRKEKEVMLCQ